MVVLAASVCTRSGKPLLSRQFRPIPRSRIDGLLAAFPKLIPANSQHTTVETADVRFVYHPFEELYVLLITNKGSNILQDIATLSLIVRLISSLTPTMTEAAILHHSFDLLCAFDEVVSLGYKENVSLNQVRNILEGDSHEEKIQEIIARNKEAEAKEELKRRAKQLEMQRREQQKSRTAGGGGGSGPYGGSYASVPAQPRYDAPPVDRDPYRSASPAPSSLKPAFKGTGMKLGKKGKQSDLIDALGGEAAVSAEDEYVAPTAVAPAPEPVSEDVLDKVEHDSVHVTVREQLSLTLLRDGGLESFELKGDLNLRITDSALAKVKLTLAPPSSGSKVQDVGNDLAFKQHPNVAKFANAKGAERVVALKDASRSFPVNNSIGVLRWRLDTKDESVVPLSINAWPQPRGDGQCDVVVEYELEAAHLSLRNVVISIPLPHNALPAVSAHNGEWRIDQRTNAFTWTIDVIDADSPSGSLEFACAADGPDDFFPMQVGFVAAGSVAEVEVASANLVDSGEAITFSQEKILTVDRFEIV